MEQENTNNISEIESNAAISFISKNGKQIKDCNAKVKYIKNDSITIYSRYDIKNIENILGIQIFILDSERTKIAIAAVPKNKTKEKQYIKYECYYKKSAGAEKFINIHKPKNTHKKEVKNNGNSNHKSHKIDAGWL